MWGVVGGEHEKGEALRVGGGRRGLGSRYKRTVRWMGKVIESSLQVPRPGIYTL